METPESIAELFGFGSNEPVQPPRFAKVVAISAGTVTVTLGSSTADAVRCCLCAVGDVVLLETLPSGQLAATGTKGINPSTGSDTTYDLTGTLASHAYTTTLTGSDGSTDTATLTLAAGPNVSLSDSGSIITIAATDTTYADATTSTAGLMSAADKTKLNSMSAYGTSEFIVGTQASATNAWTGVTEQAALYDGMQITYFMPYATNSTAATLTLTFPDSTTSGAKPVYRYGTTAVASATYAQANSVLHLTYRQSTDAWYLDMDANTDSAGYQIRTNSGTLPASDTGYRYRLWFTSADGTKRVPANTSTATNATTARTLNTRPIDPFGPIIYHSPNTTISSGSNVTANASWEQYTLTIGYTYMQSGFALTAYLPVYLKATPQLDGSAVMDSIVQALPVSDDGYIYIFLGIAYSTTTMELRLEHPVYWHDGTGIRLWTGKRPTAATDSATAGISIANHSTTSIYGVQASTTTASKVALGTAFSIPNVTAAGSGSYTQGAFTGGSLTMEIDPDDSYCLNIAFTPATHGADTHTHVVPTIGAPISVPNVTSATDVAVPIKNTSATTVATSATHTVTDGGHTHTLN